MMFLLVLVRPDGFLFDSVSLVLVELDGFLLDWKWWFRLLRVEFHGFLLDVESCGRFGLD